MDGARYLSTAAAEADFFEAAVKLASIEPMGELTDESAADDAVQIENAMLCGC